MKKLLLSLFSSIAVFTSQCAEGVLSWEDENPPEGQKYQVQYCPVEKSAPDGEQRTLVAVEKSIAIKNLENREYVFVVQREGDKSARPAILYYDFRTKTSRPHSIGRSVVQKLEFKP